MLRLMLPWERSCFPHLLWQQSHHHFAGVGTHLASFLQGQPARSKRTVVPVWGTGPAGAALPTCSIAPVLTKPQLQIPIQLYSAPREGSLAPCTDLNPRQDHATLLTVPVNASSSSLRLHGLQVSRLGWALKVGLADGGTTARDQRKEKIGGGCTYQSELRSATWQLLALLLNSAGFSGLPGACSSGLTRSHS